MYLNGYTMLTKKALPAKMKDAARSPLTLCLRLLEMSLGNANNAPIAIVKPTSK